MFFERRRDFSLRSPTVGKANGSEMYWRLADASLRLAARGINLSHPPSCVIPLGGGSPFLCGSSCDSSAQTISCSFQVPADKGSLIAMQNPVKERIVKCERKWRKSVRR